VSTLGIDVGASKINYVLLKEDERVLEGEFPSLPQTKENFLQVCQKISQEIKSVPVEKIGIGLPGTIHKDESLDFAPNFPALAGWNIKKELKKIFTTPVVIFNDAKAFIYAEAKLGAAQNFQHAVGLTLGSGLGLGIIINSTLYLGKGYAGELAHTLVDIDRNKEAEDLVSTKFFKDLKVDPIKLYQKAKAGSSKAKEIFKNFGQNLGVVIANVVNMLNPEVVVIGGGLSHSYEYFSESARETAQKLIVNPESKKVLILKARLGSSAGAVGAALLAKI